MRAMARLRVLQRRAGHVTNHHCWLSGRRQRLVEVGAQVIDVLDAD
jgi:hypothetical protein